LDHQAPGESYVSRPVVADTLRLALCRCGGVIRSCPAVPIFDAGMFSPVARCPNPTRGSVELTHEMAVASFKVRGWYLDDLVLTPVNHLTRRERKAKCRAP